MAVTGDDISDRMSDSSKNIKKSPVGELEFQVSQVICRLEEAVIGKSVIEGSEIAPSDDGINENQPRSVMQQLEDLLLHDNENEAGLAAFPELCEAGRLSVVSHAIVAYAGAMERNHIARLSSRISNDATNWIIDLFRCNKSKVCYHDEQLGGLVRIVRALLHTKFQYYLEKGFDALKNNPPVIYTSVHAPNGIAQYICKQLGLPMAIISKIPCNTLFNSQKMDLAALEREIESDKLHSKVPLMVLADAGTPITGHVDNIVRLQEICKANGIWLHLRGHSLAALAIPEHNNIINEIADSMTLPLGIWLGIPGLPLATVYNPEGLTSSSPLLVENPGKKLISLPIWTTFQCLGSEELRKRFQESFEWCHQLYRKLEKYQNIRLLSQKPSNLTVNELATVPMPTNGFFEAAASAVVFQFVPENTTGRVPVQYDILNSWLCHMLIRECPSITIVLYEIEEKEIVLRYCPLEPIPGIRETPDFDNFIKCLEQQMDILLATVKHNAELGKLVEKSPTLKLVELEGWAGLGGVRYQPEAFQNIELREEDRDYLNHLNSNLVERLRSTDAAFSLGIGDGMACIRFGMVTADTDVAELLSLVESAGLEEEESSKALDSMAEVVKRGIEAATMELQRESDEQLWQEGILRSVPVFGSLFNWLSPHNKGSGIKGRSLDLTAGIVASTENIYRYHMQSSPNQPLEQTSVSHSRSSSVSSSQPQPP